MNHIRCDTDFGIRIIAGADPGFQVREAHVKKLRRAEGGAKIVGVFRVENHDFTPKNHIFPIAEGGANIFGVFRVKNSTNVYTLCRSISSHLN